MSERLRQRLVPAIGLLLFAAALVVLHRELHRVHVADVRAALSALPGRRVAAALGLTALSYLLLTLYDTLGLRYAGRHLPWRRKALASFAGYAVSNSLGHALVTGGSLRLRLYGAWGLTAADAAAVVVFNDLALWTGYGVLAGIVLTLEALPVPGGVRLALQTSRPIGVVLLLVAAAVLLALALRRQPLRIGAWSFRAPPPSLLGTGTALGCLDWAVAGGVLYLLLPPTAAVGFAGFLGAYLMAVALGAMSQVPGGLGVVETLLVLSLADAVPQAEMLSSLLVWRLVYYLAPLAAAATALGLFEARQHRRHLRPALHLARAAVRAVLPHLLAAAVFVAGAVLLFSGATPAEHPRLRLVARWIPLGLVEASHFLASVAGAALLLLARGLQRRIDAAWWLASGLCLAGAVFSLVKGFDWEEAILLTAVLLALAAARRGFYRRSSLVAVAFTPAWIAAIAAVLAGSVWLGLFAFRHVEYASELWWRFELSADAPRFLRATVGAAATTALFALAHLLSPGRARAAPESFDRERVRSVVAASPRTEAQVALLGDKSLLWSRSGRSFLMYGIAGRSCVALGDPVGPAEERGELAWAFRELADRHGAWTVFYEVSVEALPVYLDLGLSVAKLGEEARVDLSGFSLEGRSRKPLRYEYHRSQREGLVFAVEPRERVPALLAELRTVSESWIAEKRTREKGFSIGRFDAEYLAEFPLAVLRREGAIVAFANLWCGGGQEELSVDLMRHGADAPAGTMDALFVHLLLWGHEQGYRWFNLGMAPLSGFEAHPLAPLWARSGSFLYRHGEPFYNFQGLRQYKEKFDPVWEPRYLASPGGAVVPRILANVSSLIAGGIKGVVAK